jgi:uncharacterized protein
VNRNRTLQIVTIVLGVLIIASLVLSMVGCSSDSGGGTVATLEQDAPDRGEVLAGIADDVIVPRLEDLATATAALSSSATELCAASGGSTGLTMETTAAWNAAFEAWKRTEAFRFGPAKDLHSIATIAYPIDPAKIDELFAPGGTALPISAEAVADLGADVRGLNAIEQVLYSVPDGVAITPEQCAYVAAAAADVQVGAEELRDAWTVGVDGEEPFVEQFREPGGDSMFADEQDVVNALVNGSIAALTTIDDMVLGVASGATSGTPEPLVADPGPAGRASVDVLDMLDSVTAVYGTSEGADGGSGGLSVLVAAQSLSNDRRLLETFADATAAAGALPSPLATVDPADTAAVARVQDAYDQVADARVLMRTTVASLLGVTVGFSDSDGDG